MAKATGRSGDVNQARLDDLALRLLQREVGLIRRARKAVHKRFYSLR